MSTYLKIQQGTARGDADLCRTCRNASIQVDRYGERRRCTAAGTFTGGLVLTTPVSSCTFYSNMNLPTLQSLMEIAWELSPPSSRGHMGFTTPEDRRKAGIAPASFPPGFHG